MSHNIPKNLKYTKNHEWVEIEGNTATIGITDFAQEALGDIVFTELPELHSIVKKNLAFGVVESVKSVSDIYTPVTGEVVEINVHLESSPEAVNEDPYKSWMIKVKMKNVSEIENLLDHDKYEEFCNES